MSDPLQFLPEHLRDAAAKLPKGQQHTVLELAEEGEGCNASLIRVASICYRMDVSSAATLAHLQDIYPSDRLDYKHAPLRACQRVWEHSGDIPTDSDIGLDATPQEELLLRFRRTPNSQVVDKSPDSVTAHPADIIRTLFEPKDVICIQRTGTEGGTLVRVNDLPDDLREYRFLNPATFKHLEGIDAPQPDGSTKHMTRCNLNVKSRLMILLEYDADPTDKEGVSKMERFNSYCNACAEFIPRILIVNTGGKSIHNWFDARDATAAEITAFFNLAVQHGADKAMGAKSQIARMPNVGSAGPGRDAQTVLYFDKEGVNYPEGGWDIKGLEDHIQRAEQLEYYYHKSNQYYMQDNSDNWIVINRQSLGVHLATQSIRPTKMEGEVVSPVERLIATFETDKHIESALIGASGKHAGYYEENGFKFLVLKSPKFIVPRKGDWSTIRDHLKWMFRETPEEFDIFCGMHSASIKNLRNGGRREARHAPCQAMIIAGDADAGKSFMVNFLLPAMYGGRWANANPYFDPKGSDFNSEMFGSELLILDDSAILEAGHKAKHIMSEKIKEITVGIGDVYHGKFGDKVSAKPWWRLIRMMNTTPEALATLPLLDEGMADKWVLLNAGSMDGGPVDKSQPGWFDPWCASIVAEIPAFLHYLIRELKISDDIRDPAGRYAVKSYKNEKLVAMVQEDSTETGLMHKIDNDAASRLFTNDFDGDGTAKVWSGTSSELFDILSDVGNHSHQNRFSKMCPTPRVLTSQLQALEKTHPTRIAYSGRGDITPKKLGGVHYWQITPKPSTTSEDCF